MGVITTNKNDIVANAADYGDFDSSHFYKCIKKTN